jgi:shikimate dehydrogenase
MTPTGAATVAGVAGAPVAHSLSPRIHAAWLRAAGVDGVYAPFAVAPERFELFVESLRGGAIRGLNVTSPFKERALALADATDRAARGAGAANLLLFTPDGLVEARNTDGLGLLAAFAEQAPALELGGACAVILGASGAARSAAAALRRAGMGEIRVVNRTLARAEALAAQVEGVAFAWTDIAEALSGANAVINATTLGRAGGEPLEIRLEGLATGAVAMDMVYRPLRTAFLREAERRGLVTVDGLTMLIGQARPSFEAFYGRPPPEIDIRAIALEVL